MLLCGVQIHDMLHLLYTYAVKTRFSTETVDRVHELIN